MYMYACKRSTNMTAASTLVLIALHVLISLCNFFIVRINGTYAAFLWVVKEGWIWHGHQPFLIKLFTLVFSMLNLAQGAFLRLAGPATLAIMTYQSLITLPSIISDSSEDLVTFLTADAEAESRELQESKIVNEQVIASIAVALYLAFYTIFMLCHTPRAVPVKDAKGKLTGKWRNDKQSAYHPFLFGVSFVICIAQLALILSVIGAVFIRLGWNRTPPSYRLVVFVFPAPYALVGLDSGIF